MQKLLATSCKLKIQRGQINADNLEVDKIPSHYIVYLGLALKLGLTICPNIKILTPKQTDLQCFFIYGKNTIILLYIDNLIGKIAVC